MSGLTVPAWEISARTAVIYTAVFIGLRVMGKRELGQMTVLDLVVILLIANAVQTSTALVQDGKSIAPHVRKEGIEQAELEMAMREHGVESVGSVRLAVLETDRSISIVPQESRVLRTRTRIRQMRRG